MVYNSSSLYSSIMLRFPWEEFELSVAVGELEIRLSKSSAKILLCALDLIGVFVVDLGLLLLSDSVSISDFSFATFSCMEATFFYLLKFFFIQVKGIYHVLNTCFCSLTIHEHA